MGGRDEGLQKQLAREDQARVKAHALVTVDEVHDLVRRLAEQASEQAALAARLAQAGHFEAYTSWSLPARATSNVADELLSAYHLGKPISLKARLEAARQKLAPPDKWERDQRKAHEKLLSKSAKAKKVAV